MTRTLEVVAEALLRVIVLVGIMSLCVAAFITMTGWWPMSTWSPNQRLVVCGVLFVSEILGFVITTLAFRAWEASAEAAAEEAEYQAALRRKRDEIDLLREKVKALKGE